jgi:hypothetical protein
VRWYGIALARASERNIEAQGANGRLGNYSSRRNRPRRGSIKRPIRWMQSQPNSTESSARCKVDSSVAALRPHTPCRVRDFPHLSFAISQSNSFFLSITITCFLPYYMFRCSPPTRDVYCSTIRLRLPRVCTVWETQYTLQYGCHVPCDSFATRGDVRLLLVSSLPLWIQVATDHVYNRATRYFQYSSPSSSPLSFHSACRRAIPYFLLLFSLFDLRALDVLRRANEPTHVLPYCRTLTLFPLSRCSISSSSSSRPGGAIHLINLLSRFGYRDVNLVSEERIFRIRAISDAESTSQPQPEIGEMKSNVV